MPQNCCVPNCTKKKYRTENGEKISYLKFPDDVILKKRWLHAIRRDEGKAFRVNQNTKICSRHFKPEDLVKAIGGQRVYVKAGVIPSRFSWSKGSPKKRAPPKCRNLSSTTECSNKELQSSQSQTTADAAEATSETCTSSAAFSYHDVENSLSSCEDQTEEVKKLEGIRGFELENAKLKAEIEVLKRQRSLKDSRLFQLRNFTTDEDIAFYTGFPNLGTFNAVFEFLNTGSKGENIRYCSSKERTVQKEFYDSGNEEPEGCTSIGRRRSLEPREEFFLVLCRLRRGFAEKHLAHLFGISQSTVSRTFLSWINYMYLKFGQVSIWPNREVIRATMPDSFKEKYSCTRVIIDCTEIRCQMPSSLLLNSKLFSSYKNHVTLKGLVGIAPSGAITFISQLYSGSISDREIVERSGFLKLEFDNGDTVMADKGFTVEDLLPLGVTLNIPPFLGSNSQMTAEDVIKTQEIASVRIHVERAINKIKNFHLWDSVVPLSLFGVVNQMWSVCAFLCNIQDPLIST